MVRWRRRTPRATSPVTTHRAGPRSVARASRACRATPAPPRTTPRKPPAVRWASTTACMPCAPRHPAPVRARWSTAARRAPRGASRALRARALPGGRDRQGRRRRCARLVEDVRQRKIHQRHHCQLLADLLPLCALFRGQRARAGVGARAKGRAGAGANEAVAAGCGVGVAGICHPLKTPYRDGRTHVVFEPPLACGGDAPGWGRGRRGIARPEKSAIERHVAMSREQRLKRVCMLHIHVPHPCVAT